MNLTYWELRIILRCVQITLLATEELAYTTADPDLLRLISEARRLEEILAKETA